MKQLVVIIFVLLLSCTRDVLREEVTLQLVSPEFSTRAQNPDESLITDFNIYIFNQFGVLEKKLYISSRELSGGDPACTVRLIKDTPYIILAAANMGYELKFGSLEEALAYRFHMAYPDEFSQGMPMSAYLPEAVAGEDALIEIPLVRLMARVNLCIDRRGLAEDVSMRISSVQVCGSACSALLFAPSRIEYWSELFTEGYTKSGNEIYWLNHDTVEGVSGEVPFYLLENRPGGVVQSYLEVRADYHSSVCHTKPGEPLIYRFYLTEDPEHDARRGVCYQITLRPEGSGIEEPDGWSLDKSSLIYTE